MSVQAVRIGASDPRVFRNWDLHELQNSIVCVIVYVGFCRIDLVGVLLFRVWSLVLWLE